MLIRRSALLRLALLAAAAAPWLFGAGRAEGGPPADDGVPSGTIAFFTGGQCPPGWQVVAALQGRAVVGAPDAAGVGVKLGAPLGDREDRKHQHTYTGTVTLTDKSLAAADGSNDNGAAAQAYTVSGTTADQVSGLPFIQVQPCAKP
jgi:hypothetical protein